MILIYVVQSVNLSLLSVLNVRHTLYDDSPRLRHSFERLLRRKATCPREPLGAEKAVLAAYLAVINSTDDA